VRRLSRPRLICDSVGAKQNRTLNVSVLCPPATATTIPVSCVEAGRWGAPRAGARSHHHAPNRLRGHKTASVIDAMGHGVGRVSDQGRVWADVEEYAIRAGTHSATAALEDVYLDAGSETCELAAALRPFEGQRGVIAAVAGNLISLDLFDKPASLASYWDGLLAGYALEAMRQPCIPTTLASAKAFATTVMKASAQRSPATGLGQELRLAGPGVIGLGVEWEGARVHLAAFTHEREPTRVLPIQRRRRR
jgi:hypothetical protein